MSDVGEFLKAGELIRIRPLQGYEWSRAYVVVASTPQHGAPLVQSVVIALMDEGLRTDSGALYMGGNVPLTIDYEAETVADILGNEFYVEVAEPGI